MDTTNTGRENGMGGLPRTQGNPQSLGRGNGNPDSERNMTASVVTQVRADHIPAQYEGRVSPNYYCRA